MTQPSPAVPRRIRSFVRRQGRMTDGQRRAFELLWDRFGIALSEGHPIDLAAAFGREAPLVVEIGFGDGAALAAMAAADPGRNFLGIEVHRPGVGHLLRLLDEREIGNVRVVSHDAVEVLERHLPDGTLDGVRLYFPDPWHKTRHHKRRIVQPPFAELIARKLRPGGLVHLATDWEEYARWMMTVLEGAAGFANVAGPGCFSPRPEWRPLTKFEARGQRLGHGVWDLLYRRR